MSNPHHDDMDESVTNAAWVMDAIKRAESIERLESLAETIKYDQWEDEPYACDEDTKASLREAWAKRHKELRGKDEP